MKYCVYLTIYKGNKLPPFYIGYSSVDKIEKGYRGSISSKLYSKIYISELKINPSLFSAKILKLFETRKEALEYENYLHKKFDVIKNPLYINMAFACGCFGDYKVKSISEEHKRKIGIANKGKKRDEKFRQKMSKLHKGKKLSEELKKRLSDFRKSEANPLRGRKLPAEVKQKLKENHWSKTGNYSPLQHAKRGKDSYVYDTKWITNGIYCKRIKSHENIPEGFYLGRSPLKKSKIKFKYITNGLVDKKIPVETEESLFVGFRLGRSTKRNS